MRETQSGSKERTSNEHDAFEGYGSRRTGPATSCTAWESAEKAKNPGGMAVATPMGLSSNHFSKTSVQTAGF